MTIYERDLHDINLRMAQSTFSLNTSDQSIKLIHFQIHPRVFWKLWKTEFQINSYHTISSDNNFTKNLDKIVSFESGETYHGTISETQFASGTGWKCFPLVNVLDNDIKLQLLHLRLGNNLEQS